MSRKKLHTGNIQSGYLLILMLSVTGAYNPLHAVPLFLALSYFLSVLKYHRELPHFLARGPGVWLSKGSPVLERRQSLKVSSANNDREQVKTEEGN